MEAIISENEWGHVQELSQKYGGGARKPENMMSPSFLKGIIRCRSCDMSNDSKLLCKKRHDISLLRLPKASEVQIM